MRHLILGGTGTVGSQVVRALLERGEEVRVMSRSADKLDDLPEGATGVRADLSDPDTFDDAFRGIETLFLLNAVSPAELQEGLFAVEEARRGDVERVVHLSVQDAEAGPLLPHFAAKVAVERAVRTSGLEWTVLRPNSFYQNDLWVRDALLEHGVYPHPLGRVGLSRVDVADIAEAAARALTAGEPWNRSCTLAGPDTLTGPETAEVWGEVLGREVRYGGDDLDAWERQAHSMLPAFMVYDFRLMYELFQERGLVATEEQRAETRTALGREPRSFRAFAEEAARGWV